MLRRFLCILFCLTAFLTKAQVVVSGKVTDSESGSPIERVIVKIVNRENSSRKILAYSYTDANGEYSIKVKTEVKRFFVEFSLLSYKSKAVSVDNISSQVNASLISSALELKEVHVRPKDITTRGDTIEYNVLAFKSKTDRSIEDVIRRLPGISVKSSGKIEYNGEPINKFYIEGLDMLEGRYSLASKNISANDVRSVEVLENHQHKQVLKDLVYSERAALNLRLKKKSMLRPVGTFSAGGGYSDKPLLLGEVYSLFVAPQMQFMVTAKANNSDDSYAGETTNHIASGMSNVRTKASSLMSGGLANAQSLSANRYKANKSISSSINTIRKVGKETTITLYGDYSRDNGGFNYSKQSSYFLGSESISISEQSSQNQITDRIRFTSNYVKNSERLYLNNSTAINVDLGNSQMDIFRNNDFRQEFTKKEFGVLNNFSFNKRKGSNLFSLGLIMSLANMPESLLQVKSSELNRPILQKVSGTSFNGSTSTSFSRLLTKSSTVSANVRLNAQYDKIYSSLEKENMNSVNDNGGYKIITTADLTYQYKKGSLLYNIVVPVTMYNIRYSDAVYNTVYNFNRPLLSISSYLKYDFSPKFLISLNVGRRHSLGDIMSFVLNPIQQSYSSMSSLKPSGIMAQGNSNSASMGLQYKDPMEGFFSTFSLGYAQSERNLLSGSNVSNDGDISSQLKDSKNKSEMANTRFYISKNVREISTLFSLNANSSFSKSKRVRQGLEIPFYSNNYNITPEINFSPVSRLSVRLNGSYNLSVNRVEINNKKVSTPISSYGSSLQAAFIPISKTEVFFSADFSATPLSQGEYKKSLFMDCGVRYVAKVIEIELKMNNITNQTLFFINRYSEMDRMETVHRLRPRSLMLSAKFRY